MINKETQNSIHSGRLLWYLLLVAALSAFCYVTLNVWLLPYSVAYSETGAVSVGYVLYVIIGLLFSTPTPFIAVLIISLIRDKISVKQLFSNIMYTENKGKTILITGGFCLFTTGWRGLLQPEMEKRMPFPFSVLTTSVIWYAWHYPVWLDPTSHHYGDSMIGFGITILIWAFALAAIYKATKSIIACAVYHAFIDSIGVIFDWNALFDPFPGDLSANVFRILWLAAALILWFAADRMNHGQNLKAGV